jgi:hypothetical protein
MFRILLKPYWILLTIIIAFTASFFHSLTLSSASITNSSQHPTAASESAQLKQLRQQPRQRPGARGEGEPCVISPGVLERQNIVWNEQPLFLWNASSKVMLQQLKVIDESGKILWQKSLAATDQSALYDGQPLQPGQFYTWQLSWTAQGTLQDGEQTAGDADYTFRLMEPAQQQQITSELETLAQKLQASGEDSETVAIHQADYLVTRSEPLWSDALQVLYRVENPSQQTIQTLQGWIDSACAQAGNADAPTDATPSQ